MLVNVTTTISTKNRLFTTLPMAISSIAMQTVKPKRFIVFDDSGEKKDLRNLSPYDQLFRLLTTRKIEWSVLWGKSIGQVANHQAALEAATTEFVWRLDDDNVAEPNTLEILLDTMKDDVGVVGGLVLHPPDISILPSFIDSRIEHIWDEPNCQWFIHPNKNIREVDHLYSTFLYRTAAGLKAGGYSCELSPMGFREETMFTYSIKRAGYKVLVNPKALTWHLRAPQGGIRDEVLENQYHDERIFCKFLETCKIQPQPAIWVIHDAGLGDQLCFKQILPELLKINTGRRIIIATDLPEVFASDQIELISLADARLFFGNIDKFNIYKWMWQRNWKDSLINAYRKMYLR
jgi:hypothetical protein